MVWTKYDRLTFIARTVVVLALFIYSWTIIQEAAGVNGYPITALDGDKATINCGLFSVIATIEQGELTVHDRVAPTEELRSIGMRTEIAVLIVLGVVIIWHILLTAKVPAFLKRRTFIKNGHRSTGNITGYENYLPGIYTIVINEKYRPGIFVLKSDMKKFYKGKPCFVYFYGLKQLWVEFPKEKSDEK